MRHPVEGVTKMNALTLAALGTGFTFLMTAAGAAVVFLFKNEIKPSFQRVFLGFAAGVMIAASVWSLLIPSIEMAGEQGVPGWLPAAGGFALGALFLMVLDALMPHLHPGSSEAEGVHTSFKRTTLLVLAVTLHNIPEGMAVGLACALAAGGGSSSVTLAGAMALCLGMGLQNFPEGAAISLPLRREGLSRPKSFVYGALSGIVEPIGGILAVLIAGSVTPLMPWFLSFAAGAMIYVVVEELIPEAHLGEHSHPGTLGVLAGFLVMMVLDVALGCPMERRDIFRRARPEDAGDIVRLYNSNPCFLERHLGCRAVDGTFVLQEWRQMKKEGFSTTVIADAQTGAAVGFIDCRDSEPVYLSLFLLDAALQGKGLGTELYREFEEMQRRRGRKGIRIDVVDDYEGNLVPFWKRRGFEEGEEITLEWGGKASRARVMYRNLI